MNCGLGCRCATTITATLPVATVAAIGGCSRLDRGLRSRAAVTVSAAVEMAALRLLRLLRLGLVAQLRLGAVLNFRRDAGLADPVGMGLCTERRGRPSHKGQGGGNQKTAHRNFPVKTIIVTSVNRLGSLCSPATLLCGMSDFSIRTAHDADAPVIISLLAELAGFEKLLDRFILTEEVVRRDMLGNA